MSVIFELFIILVLIMLNGFLSMAEFALVSSRKVRLEQMAEEDKTGAKKVLELINDPNNFLSAIQIGITLIGILAGAFGGVSLSKDLEPYIALIPNLSQYADLISLLIIVLIITFVTIVVGELVPKRIGLTEPEKTAIKCVSPIYYLVKITGPVIFLTSGATNIILKILGSEKNPEETVTEEEISVLLEEGTRAGVFNETEQEIVESVFRFADRDVASIMVPRPDFIALDLDDSFEKIKEIIASTGHTRYPVFKHDIDQISGVVSVRDLFVKYLVDKNPILTDIIKPVLMVPESLSTIRLLEMFKGAASPLAIVVDEYGSVLGIVTLHDLIEGIVGDMDSVDMDSCEPDVVEREDGSWYVDGTYSIIDLKELLGLSEITGEEEYHFRTVAGFVMAVLDKIPVTGDYIFFGGYKFEVADMDGHRIDKLLILPDNEKVNENSINV